MPQRQMFGDRGVDLLVARIRPLGEERRHGHDHAGLAVAALRHLVVYPGLLHRVQLAVLLQPLDGRDRHPLGRGYRQGAGADGPAVEVHGAGPAGRDAAPELGARQAERVPEHPQQRRVGFHVYRAGLSVHRKRDCHDTSPSHDAIAESYRIVGGSAALGGDAATSRGSSSRGVRLYPRLTAHGMGHERGAVYVNQEK